jgi:uncharacterized protein YecT (DUF1311 family)
MKPIESAGLIAVASLCFVGSVLAGAEFADPCRDKRSNVEMRECYLNEQARVNANTDLLANHVAAEFRKQAQDPVLGRGVIALLRKAASEVTRSQKTWKAYRDQHCNAVADSWTTGSGAGTTYERCLFQLGQARLQELRSSFILPEPK